MHHEILPRQELNPGLNDSQTMPAKSALPSDAVRASVEQQKQMLKSLEPLISRKLYYWLEERLERHNRELENYMGFERQKKAALSGYSFILDRNYFEQIFLD